MRVLGFLLLSFLLSVNVAKSDVFQKSNGVQVVTMNHYNNNDNVYFFVGHQNTYTNYKKQYYSNNFNHLFTEIGYKYHIDPKLLYAIAVTESSLNPEAVNHNTNNTVDLGLMQINSCHLGTLSKYGISEQSLFIPKINITVGAWILSKCINQYGYTWSAVACYHTGAGNTDNREATNYIWKVFNNLK